MKPMNPPKTITGLNCILIYEPDAEIITPPEVIHAQLKAMEEAGRTCYKSENLITEDSHKRFLKMLIDRHHESVLEHSCVSVKLRTNLGVARELERHRHSNIINDHMLALSCESTRYVNQGKEKFGRAVALCPGKDVTEEMLFYINETAGVYLYFSEKGVKPDVLRALLPLCAKADMVFTASIREWRAVLKLRLSKAAHDDVRAVMSILLDKFMAIAPELFEDIYYEN
jgi:thymidylate synthase (FAD)